MYLIQVTSDEIQEQLFTLFDINLRLTLYYNPVLSGWQFDLYNIDSEQYITQRKGLSASSPALLECNLPFVVVLVDKSGLGINPANKDDLISRFHLYFVEREAYYAAVRQKLST